MTRLTEDFDHNGRRGYLARHGDGFAFVTPDLPPIPVPAGAELLCRLSNADIIRYGAGVPCRERRSPYED